MTKEKNKQTATVYDDTNNHVQELYVGKLAVLIVVTELKTSVCKQGWGIGPRFDFVHC
jgi:peroxiredoxin